MGGHFIIFSGCEKARKFGLTIACTNSEDFKHECTIETRGFNFRNDKQLEKSHGIFFLYITAARL